MTRIGYLFFLTISLLFFSSCKDECKLPFLGTHEVVADDTIYYTIPKFYGWKDQDGNPLDFKNETTSCGENGPLDSA